MERKTPIRDFVLTAYTLRPEKSKKMLQISVKNGNATIDDVIGTGLIVLSYHLLKLYSL